MAKIKLQKDYRRDLNAEDQHGRDWGVTIERETNDPCSMRPNFDDPMRTPHKYLDYDADDPLVVFIDYRRWAVDNSNLMKQWTQDFHKNGRELHGISYDAAKFLKKPSPELMAVMGRPPLSTDLIKLAAEGEPQLIGEEPLVNAKWRDELGLPPIVDGKPVDEWFTEKEPVVA